MAFLVILIRLLGLVAVFVYLTFTRYARDFQAHDTLHRQVEYQTWYKNHPSFVVECLRVVWPDHVRPHLAIIVGIAWSLWCAKFLPSW